jgi:3',5'-nucleoside bisphosphate phosphatase
MRKICLAAIVLLAVQLPASAHEPSGIDVTRVISFPKLLDGRSVLAVDLHTHSVFSDGKVWPDVRVEEAKRDGLYAMAVSEHLEYQPHAKDIPHPDRNRSYELASQAAIVKPDAEGANTRPLMVINGSEITKLAMPPGHINAVFIKDANALMGTDPLKQLQAANAQGAFVFWNHPYWDSQKPDGVAVLTPMHADFIKKGLLHGIEIANGADMSDEAFQIALDNKLTILGTSDIHGLIDWDYDLEHGAKRTATLVLTGSETQDGLETALKYGQTVAIYNGNLAGLPANVEAVVRGSLHIEVGAPRPNSPIIPVRIVNDSPIDYLLENTGPEGFYDEANVFTVKAHSRFDVRVTKVADPAKLSLTFRVMNTYTAPRQHLTLSLRDAPKPN